MESRQQKPIDLINTGIYLVETITHVIKAVINPVKAGVNLIQAVIDHANVGLNFSPECLKSRHSCTTAPRRGTALLCSAGLWSAGLIVAEGLEAMGSGRGIRLAFPHPPGLWHPAGELSRIRPSAG